MKYIHTKPDGSVTLTMFAAKELIMRDLKLKTMTDAEYEEFCLNRLKQESPADTGHTKLADDYVLPDLEYFNAWVQKGQALDYDLVKAKNIALTNLRAKRDPLMAKYDGLQSRAVDLEDATEIAKVKIFKAELRGATDALKALTPLSIEDIKNATPDLSVY